MSLLYYIHSVIVIVVPLTVDFPVLIKNFENLQL